MWFTPRFLWTLAVIALLLACSPGVAFFIPLAEALAAALALATIADALLGPHASQIVVKRTPPEHFALGVATTIAYTVENHSAAAVRVGVLETPARTLRFDADETIAAVPPRSRVTATRPVVPIARGADTLGALYVWYESPVGLLRRRVRIPAQGKIRVYPDLSAVERYGALHVRNRTIEAGLRRMKLRGIGTEFESLREWADGDPFRSVDWKATARRGKLMVAQYEVERSQNIMLLLDCGRLMTARIDDRRKLDYAVQAALSLATIAGLASDRVGLVAFAQRILAAQAPRSTHLPISNLTNALYDLEPRFEEANYSRAFGYLRHHLHKRSMIVLLTDVIDPLAQATLLAEAASLARRHLLVCVFMNDAAVNAALATEPQTVTQAYRYDIAVGLSNERRAAKALLERTGALVIDVPAKQLSTALIDEYLRAKRRALL
ncbi:MAG: DUF58 domain-containing protein [Candidatus Eremiobacteraeota bacterium]|nr:DUF58 domain-containing protein [Candidatus Eremiobacteraeota bacterium]MBV9057388.1 DUF58 domain-containing protein [Candidatus Eremiobacteraeota bacterium]MBV9700093.1 DUF58 domain-containing protein [Candidatus Eremiobacteraeota bacterium]